MNERPEIVCATCGTDEKALYDAVAKVIEQYKEKEGSLIMVLHAAQEILAISPMELQEFIADGMDLPVSEVSGVVSFYSFFSTQREESTRFGCARELPAMSEAAKKLWMPSSVNWM